MTRECRRQEIEKLIKEVRKLPPIEKRRASKWFYNPNEVHLGAADALILECIEDLEEEELPLLRFGCAVAVRQGRGVDTVPFGQFLNTFLKESGPSQYRLKMLIEQLCRGALFAKGGGAFMAFQNLRGIIQLSQQNVDAVDMTARLLEMKGNGKKGALELSEDIYCRG